MAAISAIVYHGPGDVRVERVPMPVCGDGELLVKIDACAVCGSDFKAYVSGNPRIRPPMVMGHEFTGIIIQVGQGVSGFALGQRVVMATSISCGQCYYCRRGNSNLCAELAPMGFSYAGGMAQFTVIPARAVRNGHMIAVPPQVSATHAALAEPISCAVNAMENAAVAAGQQVVVIGAGPMGIINGCVARQFGAAGVVMAEVNTERLIQAKAFGFDALVNPAEEDLRQLVLQRTGGIGADVVIVAAPGGRAQEQALALARKHGSICLFASLPAGKSMLSLDSRLIHYGELRLVGSSDSTPAQVRQAVELIAGGSDWVGKLVTHELKFEQVMQAFDLMKSGRCLRVVLTP